MNNGSLLPRNRSRRGNTGSPWNWLLDRGQSGARIRLGSVLGMLLLYWFTLGVLSDFPRVLPDPALQELPFLLGIVLDVLSSFFAPRILIFLIPALAGLWLGFLLGSLHLSDLFELETPSIANRYLLGSLFGIRYPTLHIDRGSIEELDHSNPLLRIGGPGYLILHLGFAAVFETVEGHPRIYGPPQGSQGQRKIFISGFERIRDVIDLRDQLREIDNVRTVTLDGVEVFARDVKVVFRVYGGETRTLDTPYPYDPRSLLSLVYGQIITETGPSRWDRILPELARNEIKTFVANRSLQDFLTLPITSEPERSPVERGSYPNNPRQSLHIPRRLLTESFHTEERRSRLREIGLELVWVGVGTWEVRDDQLPSTGGEIPAGQTLATLARDEARIRRLRSMEYLRQQRHSHQQRFLQSQVTDLVTRWLEGSLPEDYRCYEWLQQFKLSLKEYIQRAQEVYEGPLDPGLQAVQSELNLVVEHLESITESRPSL